MGMKTHTIIKTTALILALITVSITTAAAIPCDCGNICVNTDGWWRNGGMFHENAAPIQAAVDNANAGDVIYVKAGNYNENVDIAKAHLTLAGEGADVVTVTAADSGDYVFEVTANYVSITGFSVTGATGTDKAGICLNEADHCDISDNTASNNYYYGIYLYFSNDNTLTDNTASHNYGDDIAGIFLYFSNDNTLTDNTASHNDGDGIYLESSSNNMLTGNTALYNYDGIYLYSSNDNTLKGNTASNNNGDGIDLWGGSSDNLIYNNYLDNTHNSYDDGSNQWNAAITTGPNIIGGPFIGGNYWSNYAGTDPDRDGFGEEPYDITGGSNQDHLPLVHVTCVRGDVDENGILNIMDARLLMNRVADLSGYPVAPCAGDFDGDGDIDGVDVGLLLNQIFNPSA